MDYFVLETFDGYIEAHILLGKMQEEGIECWLKDENIVTINPVWANAVGGIKLMVAQSDVERAVELLALFKKHKREFYSCPKCGSNNIEHIKQKPNSSTTAGYIKFLFSTGSPLTTSCIGEGT